MTLSVLEEFRFSQEHPEYSDDWSYEAVRIYFDAAAFHGLEVTHENVPDIYSYAMEAAAAFEAKGPRRYYGEEMATACRDWHSGRLSRSRFLETVATLCEEERHGG